MNTKISTAEISKFLKGNWENLEQTTGNWLQQLKEKWDRSIYNVACKDYDSNLLTIQLGRLSK